MSQDIITALKALKLHGMAANYPEVAAQARHTDFTPEAFTTQLLKAEQADRAVRSMAYQMGAARFPAHRDLAGFEFTQASVDEALVRTLHREPVAKRRSKTHHQEPVSKGETDQPTEDLSTTQ